MGTESLKYQRIIRAVGATVWGIVPQRLCDIMEVLTFKAQGGELSAEEIRAYVGDKVAAAPRAQTTTGGIAVLSIRGIIAHRIEQVDEISGPGGTSVERFAQRFREAMANDAIGTIVLDIDSPGGSVDGVPELAAEILAARESKRIVAVANTLAASAAYWIGSAASEFSVTPSGEVGSIGVFAAHSDLSRRLEMQGKQVTLIHAGKYKVEGNPFEPLSDEARADVQARVDEVHAMFTKAIAKGRGVEPAAVRGGFGEGRTLGAKAALGERMVDRIETLDEAISRLRGRRRATRARAHGIHFRGAA